MTYVGAEVKTKKTEHVEDEVKWVQTNFGPGPFDKFQTNAIRQMIMMKRQIGSLEKKVHDLQHTF